MNDKSMIKKICGLTQPEDAELCVTLGANALGFVFYAPSPRCASVSQAKHCLQQVSDVVYKVGVMVNPCVSEVLSVAQNTGLNTIQLHGNESPEFCLQIKKHYRLWKALRVNSGTAANIKGYENSVDGFLLDATVHNAWGGTGTTCNWDLASEIIHNTSLPVILAGGLGPTNIQDALKQVEPAGIDASSRLEVSPGRKNKTHLRAFFNALQKE